MMDELSTCPPALRPTVAAMLRVNRARLRVHMPEWVHLDLSLGQLKTLMALASRRPMSVGAVAATLGVGKPTASILVDRLVQLGYAQRTEDPDDRRRTWVDLTPAGGDLVARLSHVGGERFASWLEQMDPDDLAALRRGLEALAAVAERDVASQGTVVTIKQ